VIEGRRAEAKCEATGQQQNDRDTVRQHSSANEPHQALKQSVIDGCEPTSDCRNEMPEQFEHDLHHKMDYRFQNETEEPSDDRKDRAEEAFRQFVSHPPRPDSSPSAGSDIVGRERLSSVASDYSASANGLNLVSRS
jgi:hypothetical protein